LRARLLRRGKRIASDLRTGLIRRLLDLRDDGRRRLEHGLLRSGRANGLKCLLRSLLGRGDMRLVRGLRERGLRRWLIRLLRRGRGVSLTSRRLLLLRRRPRLLRGSGGRRCLRRCARELAERVHETERRRHSLDCLGHRGVIIWLRLELRERGSNVLEGHVGVGQKLRSVRALDLMERPHRLRDWRREIHQARRDVGVGLKG
jgi:hypothetical protein